MISTSLFHVVADKVLRGRRPKLSALDVSLKEGVPHFSRDVPCEQKIVTK